VALGDLAQEVGIGVDRLAAPVDLRQPRLSPLLEGRDPCRIRRLAQDGVVVLARRDRLVVGIAAEAFPDDFLQRADGGLEMRI
jgi:hypothetical protein